LPVSTISRLKRSNGKFHKKVLEIMNNPLTLVNPINGNLAFRLITFDDGNYFDCPQRNNYYSLILISRGSGRLSCDFSNYSFKSNTLFSFSPYQAFMFFTTQDVKGVAIQFHPDFFCIHKHQREVACNGVLFNNIYQPPFVVPDQFASSKLNALVEQIRAELISPGMAQCELLVSYLKIFLITASRLKTEQQSQACRSVMENKEPFILQDLKDSIEKNFKTKHSPADYASTLNISVKALAKMTKSHFNKTITELISERVMIEAKRELYLTNKAIREIAYELGYEDEYYFSRFFKVHAQVSPQLYRKTVGFDKSPS
jgi:AraC family transcriptional regulator, transcriptional activator of pobA